MNPTSLDNLPREDLDPAQHGQVRAMLVRQARQTRRRQHAVRWAVPTVLAGAAAVSVAVAAGGLWAPEPTTTALVTPTTDATTEVLCVPRAATPHDVPDQVRLLSTADTPTLDGARPTIIPAGCNDVHTRVAAWAEVESDGTIRRAVSATIVDEDAESRPFTGNRRYRFMYDGRPTQSATLTDFAGTSWQTTAINMTEADVLTLLNLNAGARVPMEVSEAFAGLKPLPEAAPPPAAADHPTWSLSYGSQMSVSVTRSERPWQQEVAYGDRVVDIGGHKGLFLFGSDQALSWLHYDVGDGYQVRIFGPSSADGHELIAFAETLRPVGAEDPRLLIGTPTEAHSMEGTS